MKITLNGVPPSLNRFAGRENSREYRTAKDTWTRIAWAAARQAGAGRSPPPHKALVAIIYHFSDRRRRDPDNYCGKFLLDGLTKARAIVDDSFDHIRLLLDQGDPAERPWTEVTVTEFQGETPDIMEVDK